MKYQKGLRFLCMSTPNQDRFPKLRAVAALALLALRVPVLALTDAPPPTFVFRTPEEVKTVEWKATAQAGLGATTGNSQAFSLSFNAAIDRRSGDDKISAEVAGALARTRIFVAAEQNGIAGLGPGETREVSQTTSQAWSLLGRYDRFVARHDAVYVSATISSDEPAGKRLLAGGQLGYRRSLFLEVLESVPDGSVPEGSTAKSAALRRELVLELGYDFTHQAYVSPNPPIVIHSGRAFLGYHADTTLAVTFDASIELLTNLNSLTAPTRSVSPFYWNRIMMVLGATARLAENGSVGLRFSAHYDSVPAPRPPPPGFSYEPGYIPLADRIDTKTELLLIWRLL